MDPRVCQGGSEGGVRIGQRGVVRLAQRAESGHGQGAESREVWVVCLPCAAVVKWSYGFYRVTVNVNHPFCQPLILLANKSISKCGHATPRPLLCFFGQAACSQSGLAGRAEQQPPTAETSSHSSFTFDALRASHPRRPGVTRGSAPAGVAWSSHGALGSRRSRLSGGSLYTWAGFTPGRSSQGLKQCR